MLTKEFDTRIKACQNKCQELEHEHDHLVDHNKKLVVAGNNVVVEMEKLLEVNNSLKRKVDTCKNMKVWCRKNQEKKKEEENRNRTRCRLRERKH